MSASAPLQLELSTSANRETTIGGEVQLPLVLHTRVITGSGGGPDKTILNSPRFLPSLGYRAICAFLHPPHDDGFQVIRDRADKWQADLEEIDDRGALDWRIFKQLLAVCRRHRVAIWHAHDYKTNLLGIVLRRFHPMKLVTTAHGWVEHTRRTRLYYLIDRWSLRRYARVICVSEDIMHACQSYGVGEEKVTLIENAIDTEQFRRSTTTQAAKAALDCPPHRLLIGAVGRLSSEKGFDLLIRSLQILVKRGVDVGLLIAGNGPERTALERLISQLQLEDRVRLVGFQSNLKAFYEALDLFVLSSHREGLPNVLLEAMSYEVPVLATRIAGIPRLIQDGENGLLVDPGDAASLANRMQFLLQSAALRTKLACAGRSTIESRYSFSNRMKNVARVYDDVLRESQGGCGP